MENITYKEHEQTLLESQSRLEQLKSELSTLLSTIIHNYSQLLTIIHY